MQSVFPPEGTRNWQHHSTYMPTMMAGTPLLVKLLTGFSQAADEPSPSQSRIHRDDAIGGILSADAGWMVLTISVREHGKKED